jgi:hypothetical protein
VSEDQRDIDDVGADDIADRDTTSSGSGGQPRDKKFGGAGRHPRSGPQNRAAPNLAKIAVDSMTPSAPLGAIDLPLST